MAPTATLPTPPAPAWTQSENNLLPKWTNYISKAFRNARQQQIEEYENELEYAQMNLTNYEERIAQLKVREQGYKEEIKALRSLHTSGWYDDEQVLERYEALITSPHVVGTRIGSYGDLVILVDPKIPGAEDYELGIYELSYDLMRASMYSTVMVHPGYLPFLESSEKAGDMSRYTHSARAINAKVLVRATSLLELEKIVDTFVNYLAEHFRPRVHRYYRKELNHRDRRNTWPWSGYAENPLSAIWRFRNASDIPSEESQIKELERELEVAKSDQRYYLDHIRTCRKKIREVQTELKKLDAAEKIANKVDLHEAKKTLRHVSNLEGVIAIKFDADGIPVLHVRNSCVIDGRRYDLGDFELHLQTEEQYFGTVLKVRRTRVPIGGSYEQGWHTDANGFCFGNRAAEILNAFQAGDIGHAVNLAIGTMNSIDEGHRYDRYLQGRFQQIPTGIVWKRRVRQRQRRKARTEINATLTLTTL
jgi:hypothetical protein